MKKAVLLIAALLTALLAGCSTNKGKYFSDDGPPSGWGSSSMETEDAVPRLESPVRATNKVYTVLGKTYSPVTGDKPMVQVGYGSWYGKKFHGKKTSTGEIYNMYKMTAAHKTMELPSYARVTNLENGRSVVVRVNDRGPFLHERVIDLSYAAATKLGYAGKGTAKVKVERITRSQIARGSWSSDKTVAAAVVPPAAPVVYQPSVAINKPDALDRFFEKNLQEHIAAEETQSDLAVEEGIPLGSGFNGVSRIEVQDRAPLEGATDTPIVMPAERFAVQLGVFKSRENAELLQEKANEILRQENMQEARITHVRGLHKVLIGADLSHEEAVRVAESVKRLLGQEVIAVKE